jgi:5-histidylcysteine sulfoxide synthase
MNAVQPPDRALERPSLDGSEAPAHTVALRPPVLATLTREELITQIRSAWALTDWLFSGVTSDAALRTNPDPLRNPLVFYVGHSAAFFVNKMRAAGLIEAGIDDHLERIFAVGVDPAAALDLDLSTRYPSLDDARAFRASVLGLVEDVVNGLDLSESPAWNSPAWSLLMGLEHERIHFETSSVLLRQLPLKDVAPPPGWFTAPSGAPPAASRVRFDGGAVRLGKRRDSELYGWDNEYGDKTVHVGPFEASAHLVSNGQFLHFVEAGGYSDLSRWTDEGQAWLSSTGAQHPRFWRRNGGWRLRTVFSEQPLPLDWPAEVNHHEAAAYCRWIGGRLPTEGEQKHLSQDAAVRDGDVVFHPDHHLCLTACSPRGVAAGTPTARGVHDPVGNVWQWLSDDFEPLPGFEAHPWYLDFSALYFGPEHRLLLGGSWASTGATASQNYRLWFRPHFFQHAGFRPVWDV